MEMTSVYLVDDDPSVLRGLERLLTCAGYDVETFSSAREFLARWRPGRPACLVTDIVMQGMNGLELQKALVLAGKPPQIVFVTAHEEISFWKTAMAAGAAGYLKKPVDSADLLAAVRTALERNHDESTEHD